MATFNTVEVTLKVWMEVLAGGAYESPGYLTEPNEHGDHIGPSADKIVRTELPGRILVPRKLSFWRRLFFNSSFEFQSEYAAEVIEVIETKVTRSAYASGE